MDDVDQEYTLLEEGAEYALSASTRHNGFRLHNKSEGSCALLQDEDARRFLNDFQELKARSPDWSADQILAQLWDQGGYGWLATQEG